MKMNRDYKRRNEILGIPFEEGAKENVEINRLYRLSLDIVKKLFKEKFIDPKDNQNSSPTAAQFLKFLRKYPFATVDVYTVPISKPDYRVMIEGLFISNKDKTSQVISDFFELCKDAAEVSKDGHLIAWWN